VSKIGDKVLELDEKGLERTDENLGALNELQPPKPTSSDRLTEAMEQELAEREWELSKFSTDELEMELAERYSK
jgi:hypothetical protein